MSLEPGARLGPYEIVAAIGAGGMGEVYRALDTRLSRTVAIKVLPAELASDPLPEALFTSTASISSATRQYAVSKDGRRFLVNARTEWANVALLTVLVNWLASVQK